jgi:short-subunit dehydrogenase
MYLSQMLVDSSVTSVERLGGGTFAPFHLLDSDDWWRLLELNLRAPTDLVRAALPSMLERNSGTIICTVSRAALMNVPFTSVFP